MPLPALRLRQVVCGHDAPAGTPGGAPGGVPGGTTGGFELLVESLAIDRGEAVAFAGPSGSGKSTLLDLLALTLRPRRVGAFSLTTRAAETIDLGALWRDRHEDRLTGTRAAHLGYVLQQGGLLPFLTVRQNMALGQAVLAKPDSERIVTLARRLEIDALLDRKPATLSVGQRQRVAIGRALAHRPAIVLADEPTASVHPTMADTILALLVEQARQDDTALILTTHDPDRAARQGFEVVRLTTEATDGGGRTMVRRMIREPAT